MLSITVGEWKTLLLILNRCNESSYERVWLGEKEKIK